MVGRLLGPRCGGVLYLRYGSAGSKRPGLLDQQGRIRDLSAHVMDLTPDQLSDAGLARLRALDPATLPLVEGNPRLGVPVAGIRQCIAIGLNYRKHAAESKMEIPKEPVVFFKAITSLCGPNDEVLLPNASECTDWEIELAIIIGSTTRRATPEQAMAHVAGYTIANDVSERDWQLNRNGQWSKGKSFDTFTPLGPWLTTCDEVPDPQNLNLSLSINGEVKQQSSTADMIFSVDHIVSYCSQFMTLLPGDVIVTGTPEGIGWARQPRRMLKPGDTMHLVIEQLGEQRQGVAFADRV